MERWIASGAAVAVILALMLGEWWWLTRRRGVGRADAGLALLPGALLLLALWAAATRQWELAGTLLALSLPAHLVDLARRGW